jgi:hypothetical protein
MKNKFYRATILAFLLMLDFVQPSRAFVHPGVPLTLTDLNLFKTNLTVEPWKTGYAGLSGVSTNYVMQGPFAFVSRNPNVNNGAWKSDMQAIYDLSRMWYFTGDSNHAQKAHDILMAWATTQTAWGGAEASFDIGDYSYRLFDGAEILRGTWPGWTQADTETAKAYFLSMWWAADLPNPLRSANQGAIQLPIGLGIAVFCDDQEKFDLCLKAFRADTCGGLLSSIPNGELGDTGRHQGHTYGMMQHLTWCAEVFGKQGVDVWLEADNRLLAAGEYFARYNLSVPTTYIPFGTTYDYYPAIGGAGYFKGMDMMDLLYSHYVLRKGMNARYITQYRERIGEWSDSFVLRATTADVSTAVPPSPLLHPATSSVTTGLSLINLGGVTPVGSATYSSGAWTVSAAGAAINYGTGSSDACSFAYLPVTGDCAIIAKITNNPSVMAGVMIRETLAPSAIDMACFMQNASNVWADLRGYAHSSHGAAVQIHDLMLSELCISGTD